MRKRKMERKEIKIDLSEKAIIEQYLRTIKEEHKDDIIKELYFYGELGHKTIKLMAEENEKMKRSMTLAHM